MDEAAEAVEVLAHVFGIDEQLVDHAGQPRQREVERDRRVGADHPLDRGMRDVALVPQRDVLQRRRHRRAHHAGEAGQVLGQHRDCACAASPTSPSGPREKYSSASSTSVRCRWRISVASRSTDEATTPSAAKNAAWRSRGITWVETGSRLQPQLLRHMRLDPRVDVGEGADRAGDRAGRDFLARRDQPRARAREFGVGQRELEAEGGRLGVDAVRAADGRRQLVLEGAALERGEQRVDVGDQDVGWRAAAARRGRCRARRSWSCPDGRSARRGR